MMPHHVRDSSSYTTHTIIFKRLTAILIIGCCIAIYTSPHYRGRVIDAIRKVDGTLPMEALSFKMPVKSQDFPNNNSVSWNLPNNGPSNAASWNLLDNNFSNRISWNLLNNNSGNSVTDNRWHLLNTEALPFESTLIKLGLNNLITADEDFGNVFLDDIEIVTAWSMNHHKEAVRLCGNVQQFEELQLKKNLRLISYNLGDVPYDVLKDYLRICPIAEIRTFKFSEFPSYVRELSEYRWKPLIIADVLRTSKAILWVDSSTLFVKDTLSLQDILDREAEGKQGVWFFDKAGHSIAAATNPLMFKFFPMTAEEAVNIEMWGANTMLWISREDVRTNVLRPFVECALIKDCMAPAGSQLHCRFSELERKFYANCHRFDQSAINVIVSSRADFNVTKYTLSKTVIKTHRLEQ